MPKSRRQKNVALSKTKKKGNALKESLVEDVRACADKYENAFVFTVDNMRNTKLKELRNVWEGSKFFFGKNKVMAHALGNSPEEEHKDGISQLARRIQGDCGLLFTNTPKKEVVKYFSEFKEPNFARSGCVSIGSFSLPAGPLAVPFSMEVHLRQLGLKTKLSDGVVELLADTVVCNEGDVLTPEQCKILEIFDQQMAEFKLNLDCWWHESGFEVFEDDEDAKMK